MDYKKHIEGLRKGSYKDFKILYDIYYSNLYGFVFGLIRSESQTKEILQETFIKLWINRESINPELSFKSYLFKISKNSIVDQYKRQLNNPVFEDYLDYCDNLQLSNNDITQQLDYDQFVEKLEAAKSKLTSRQREIFELSKEQGLSSGEIATILDIKEQTVYNILSSAMNILKKEIDPAYLLLFFLFFN